MQSATARLRRTFAYPSDTPSRRRDGAHPYSDSDSDSDPAAAALDEQEQEELIASLAAQNAARDAQFRLLLLLLPACAALPYLLALFRAATSSTPSSSAPDSPPPPPLLVPLLSLSSLACTAWTLLALPPGATGLAALDGWVAGGSRDSSSNSNTLAAARRQHQRTARSPLELYLPCLNAALCGVLALAGLAGHRGQGRGHAALLLGCLPAAVYAAVLAAKAVMGSVDPERELGALRYEYKGA